MVYYYFDASAIVKYYHREPGSRWVKQIADAREADDKRAHTIYIANISLAEVPAALAVLARTHRIGLNARDAWYDEFLNDVGQVFHLLIITTELAFTAGELTQKYSLKGYDAIQLAVALDFKKTLDEQDLSLIFVSGDTNLLQAARAEGLATENPFDRETSAA